MAEEGLEYEYQNDGQNIKVYGEVCLRKQRRKRQKIMLIEMMMDYAQNCSLHGLKYIAEKGCSLVEKLFWLLTFIVSVGLCFMLIRNVWMKWVTSPVIVSFNEQIVPVGMVPFPSVTICPQVKSISSRYNFSHEYLIILEKYNNAKSRKLNATDDEEYKRYIEFDDVAIVCSEEAAFINRSKYSDSSLVEHIIKASPNVHEVFKYCIWRNRDINCTETFNLVLTTEGVCYNFNSMAASEIFKEKNLQPYYKYLEATNTSRSWSILGGYHDYDPDAYPRRGRENGPTPDLEVILIQNKSDTKKYCNPLNNGFKVYIQNPADMPQSSLYYYAALPNQVSSLALKFNMLTTDKSLKDYDPTVRQCYFPSERPLRYFKIYTANNCRIECQSNYTYHKCGCVWFNMPHNEGTRICTLSELECVDNAQDTLSIQELKAKSTDTEACRCFPDCHNIYYDAEILKTEFDVKTYFDNINKIAKKYNNVPMMENNEIEYSKIEMYFKEPRFVSMRRSELFGLTDFLANCGGLLGLFLGFSFLSLVEIIYFLTLRLFYAFKRDLKEEKAVRNSQDKDTTIIK